MPAQNSAHSSSSSDSVSSAAAASAAIRRASASFSAARRRAGCVLLRGRGRGRVDGAALFLQALHEARFGGVDVSGQCIFTQVSEVRNRVPFGGSPLCELCDYGAIVRRHENAGVEPLVHQKGCHEWFESGWAAIRCVWERYAGTEFALRFFWRSQNVPGGDRPATSLLRPRRSQRDDRALEGSRTD